MNWEHFYNCIIYNKKTQGKTYRGYTSKNLQWWNKHLNSFSLQDGPNTLRRTLRRFIERPLQPERERRDGGRSSLWYLHIGGRKCSAVRHLLSVVRLGPQSHAGARARGGTRVEQSESPGGDQGHGRDPGELHERQQIRTNERTLRMVSYLYGPPRTNPSLRVVS